MDLGACNDHDDDDNDDEIAYFTVCWKTRKLV